MKRKYIQTRWVLFLFVWILVSYAQSKQNPNHLEPVQAFDDFNYDHAVRLSLISPPMPELWMIVKPSFRSEYAVTVRRELEYKENDATHENPQIKWVVEYALAKNKVWKLKDIGGNRYVPDPEHEVDVIRHQRIISEHLAESVKNAWLSVLKLTRYSDSYYRGLDGTTYEFSCERYSGEIWSPSFGNPAKLVELGEKLSLLAQFKEDDSSSLELECENISVQIVADTKNSNQKLHPTVKMPVESGKVQGTAAEL